ncbi:4'-phosphopantetheinyl transferase family protein [Neolewinella sp.]|uniref:4'-phosphopantetheinyl transferase family protein n=1 Tax=Neolewinella sp. TaxID=2993543 RepID=UPI003B51E21A
MPLLFHDSLLPPGEWGLWSITESEDWLRGQCKLFPREEDQLLYIKGEERRREFLAARQLLHVMSGRRERAELVKDEDGKPHLPDSKFFVSISHTVGYSAAVAHPQPCGIDVQRIVPRIVKLAPKFVGAGERKQLTEKEELEQLHLIWAAKEAMYKAYGRRQLDFKRNLFVELGETATGRLRRGAVGMDFELAYKIYPTFVLVAAVQCGLRPR